MCLKKLKAKLLRIFRSLGFREQLTFLLLIVLGTTLCLYSVILYRNFLRVHEQEFDTALYNYTVDVAGALNLNLFGEVTVTDEVFRANDKIFPFALDKTVIQLRAIQGRPIAKSPELGRQDIPIDREEFALVVMKKILFKNVRLKLDNKNANYRVATYYIEKGPSAAFVVQVASPMVLLERERAGLLAFFLLSIPTTLFIAGLASYYFSSQATAPINDIIRKARAITVRKLNERLPVPLVRDEIHELASTLNELLNRLQAAFVSQESFVSDASHQLKTPLAILRGEIDLIRRERRSPEEMNEFLDSASQEVSYLSRMVEELLLLARIESGGAGLHLSPTRMDELAIEVVSRMQKHQFLVSKQVKLSFNLHGGEHADYLVHGDFDLIRTLMENLVDNAIKYTKPRTTVLVEVFDAVDSVTFDVRDQGDGFRPSDKEKIFNRFYRTESGVANARVEGSGLGLSIVKKIAEIHSAQLKAETTPGVGSDFIAIFPKKPPFKPLQEPLTV